MQHLAFDIAFMADHLERSCAAGMGLDIDAAQRRMNSVEAKHLL